MPVVIATAKCHFPGRLVLRSSQGREQQRESELVMLERRTTESPIENVIAMNSESEMKSVLLVNESSRLCFGGKGFLVLVLLNDQGHSDVGGRLND